LFSAADLSYERDPTEPEKGGGGVVTEGKQLISTNFEEIFLFFLKFFLGHRNRVEELERTSLQWPIPSPFR